MEPEGLTPTERTTAAVAHGSLLLAWLGFPVFLPFFMWMSGKNASPRRQFEVLQALGWQSLFMLYAPLVTLLILTLGGIGLAISMSFPSVRQAPEAAIMVFILGVLLFTLALMLLYLIPALIAAIRSAEDKPYAYPWVGKLLKKTLEGEDGEFRWLAAIGHLSILIPIFGIILPLILWTSRERSSEYLRRQAKQAAVYQVVGPLLGIIVAASWLMAIVVILISAGEIGLPGTTGSFHAINQIALVVYGIAALLTILYLLFLPLYTTLPLIAAWRVLQGRDYSYPLLHHLGSTQRDNQPII